jgi:poly(A) polymerase
MTAAPNRQRDFALQVVRTLRSAGFQALWAGGCVRDLLLGVEPSDYDVATDARPEQVMKQFRRTVPVGVSFGVVRVQGPPGVDEVEVATFRSDGAYIDGRRPTAVVFSSPEEDAQRRDFTINGMFFDPIKERVHDFVGGRDDLSAGVLRAIGDPFARFDEDKLRLIRAARFAARFGFSIDAHTASALRAMAPQILVVAPERIAQELRKMLVHASRARGVSDLLSLGLLAAIMPDLVALTEPIDSPSPTWPATLSALDALGPAPSFPLALAALFHALEDAPSALLRASAFLKLSNAERDHAAWLVSHLDRVAGLPSVAPSARKRLLSSSFTPELLALARASSVEPSAVSFAADYLSRQPEGPLKPAPLLTGSDLVAIGMSPGPAFKSLLDDAYNAQLDGQISTREDSIKWAQSRSARP